MFNPTPRRLTQASTLHKTHLIIYLVGKRPAFSLSIPPNITMADAGVNPTKNSPNYLPCREKARLFLVNLHPTPRRLTQASTLHKTHLIIYLVGKRPAFSLSIPPNITIVDAGVNPTRLSVLWSKICSCLIESPQDCLTLITRRPGSTL